MNADILQSLIELFQKKQYTKVLEIAAPIVDQNPVDINILNIFGTVAAITGQYQLAETTLKRALAIDVSNAELNNNLGNVFFRQKKYGDSLKYFEQAIKTQPKNCNFYNSLGMAMMLMDRIKDSEQVLKTSLMLEPENPNTHANIGTLFWEKGCIKDAQKSCLAALSFNPNHAQAKLMLIRTFEAHSPDQRVDLPTVVVNHEIRKINLEIDIKKRLADNNVIRILQRAESILTRYDLEINYPESQTYRRDETRLNCHRHERIFDEHKIIPRFCFGCFKVQVEPRNVFELIKLFLLFDWINLEANNTRKCMVELRDEISGFYKGLIYCSSLEEAKLIHKTVSTHVSQLIDKEVPCSIKRGCSEFAKAIPEFGHIEKSGNGGLMEYINEWEAIENNYDAHHPSDRPLRGAPTLRGFSLSDLLIIKNWVGYARGIGDPSVADFSLNQVSSDRLLVAARKRKAKTLPATQSKVRGHANYNIKPINIG